MKATLEYDIETENKALKRALLSTEAYIVLWTIWDKLGKGETLTVEGFNDLCDSYGVNVFNDLD